MLKCLTFEHFKGIKSILFLKSMILFVSKFPTSLSEMNVTRLIANVNDSDQSSAWLPISEWETHSKP